MTFRFVICAVVAMGCTHRVPPAAPPGEPSREVVLPATAWSPAKQATHLLNRAGFGPSAADSQRLLELGPATWLQAQLSPGVDADIEHRLSGFKTLNLSVAQAFKEYPDPRQRAKELGLDLKDPDAQEQLKEMAKAHPDELPRVVLIEASQAKLLRAALSRRQLEEVLVDFWFNHFNVSAEKNYTRWMVSAYERDAIRPFVFGRFRDLLGATAKHPAMLWYLDNWLSVRDGFELKARGQKALGLNENYARELLELHTVGVDAGYTQADVREAARALTGWSIEVKPEKAGFATFLFRPPAHDQGMKQIFGLTLPANGGQADGEQLLDFLARHPATAHHLALKLCQRFVSDTPPPALVDRVAAEYLRTDGDLRATYLAVFEAPEFWSDSAYAQKTKTPFEFVVSGLRAVGRLDEAQLPLGVALERLGAPMYRCAPPTGYSELAGPWVNAGSLVNRINFGIRLVSGSVPGVELHLPERGSTPDATIDAVGAVILGGPVSDSTKATIKRALGVREDDGVSDGELRAVDPRKVAGLLLGSPEFQKQ